MCVWKMNFSNKGTFLMSEGELGRRGINKRIVRLHDSKFLLSTLSHLINIRCWASMPYPSQHCVI